MEVINWTFIRCMKIYLRLIVNNSLLKWFLNKFINILFMHNIIYIIWIVKLIKFLENRMELKSIIYINNDYSSYNLN